MIGLYCALLGVGIVSFAIVYFYKPTEIDQKEDPNQIKYRVVKTEHKVPISRYDITVTTKYGKTYSDKVFSRLESDWTYCDLRTGLRFGVLHYTYNVPKNEQKYYKFCRTAVCQSGVGINGYDIYSQREYTITNKNVNITIPVDIIEELKIEGPFYDHDEIVDLEMLEEIKNVP